MKIFTILFVLILGLSAASRVNAQTTELHDFNFTPDPVDTRDGAKSVTFTATVSSAAAAANSGVPKVTFPLSRNGDDFAVVYKLEEISRNESGTVFQITIDFPKVVYNQTWRISGIDITDSSGNIKHLNDTEIAALGFKSSFQVIGELNIPAPRGKKSKVRFF